MSFCFILGFSIFASAQGQTLPTFENFSPGDKLSYQTKANGKVSKYEFIFTETSDAHVKGTASIDGKQM